MDVTIYRADLPGIPAKCDTEDCWNKASTVWSAGVIAGGHSAGSRYACDQHNPMSLTGALPLGFHSQSLCHACGQPVNVGSLIVSS